MRFVEFAAHALGFGFVVDGAYAHTVNRASALIAFADFGVKSHQAELGALGFGLFGAAVCAGLHEVEKDTSKIIF